MNHTTKSHHDHILRAGDTSLPATKRAELLVAMLTIDELVHMMDGDAPAVARLGIPSYHYGYEALHGQYCYHVIAHHTIALADAYSPGYAP